MININKRYLLLFSLPIIFLSVVSPVVSETIKTEEVVVDEVVASSTIAKEQVVNDSSQEPQEAFSFAKEKEDVLESREFTHTKYKYKTRYPKTWNTHDIPAMSYTRFENKDISSKSRTSSDVENYFKIEVVVLPRQGLTLEEWVKKQNTTSYPLPEVLEQRVIEVAGNNAIYQIEQFDNLVKPAFFVEKDEYIYIINPSNNKQENKKTIEVFLQNFNFNK